jgi:selenocysteine lyase/cysteine desulfurase
LDPELIGVQNRKVIEAWIPELESRGFVILPACYESSHILTMTHPDWHPSDLAMMLGVQGVSLRSGHLCAQPLLERLGIKHAIRISLGAYSSVEEIAGACEIFDGIGAVAARG